MKLITFIRTIIHFGAISPLMWLLFVIALDSDDLGADPAKEIQHFLGFVAISLFLLLFLLRLWVIFTKSFKYQVLHRPLGMWAFMYMILHILSYFLLELGGDFPLLMNEIATRYYLMIGIASVISVLLTLLSVSPLGGVFAKLGINLHKLSYVAVILGGIHYFLSTKSIEITAIMYNSIILLSLLGIYFHKKKFHRAK